MTIKAVKFREHGFYGQPVAFGGEEGPEKFDPAVRCLSCFCTPTKSRMQLYKSLDRNRRLE